MPTVKTAISLPEEIFAALDHVAAETQMSRSALIAVALREYLRRRESREMLRALDEVYREEPLSDEDRAWLDFALRDQARRFANEGDVWPTT